MAEEGSVYDLKGLEKQLQSLFSRYTCSDLQADSKPFCSSFCKLVERFASYWQVPLPQLRILEKALFYFAQVSAFFTVNCDHVLHTLSSLALSIFELLLFFDQKDFYQDPLRKITVTFQECCSALARHQNVHLLQVERLLRAGGPWASHTLQAILSESALPQTEVEESISSEPPVFFELRVRYLLSHHRLTEALALAKCCAQHPTVGQHLYFYQVYLIGLYKTSQHERLLEEVADFSGKDAVHFLCSLESEEKDELLLGLSRAFLSQQLGRGDMHFLCDMIFIWSKLHSRLKTTKEALLKECEQLMLSATNVNAIFPFIRVIIQELSEDGVQFCVELCANALRSCLPCDVITKSLIYKTIASLLPSDLEICRACALLVFFLERSVEAYKMVYILYMHPDQEYHVDLCPIGNRIRFETLQTLKKDLYFDPEFWNLIALRTNCLKLMNEKVVSAALEEIMEEKWVPSYCRKAANSSSSRSVRTKENGMKVKKQHKEDTPNHKDGTDKAPRKKVGRPRLNNHHSMSKKGNQRPRQWKDLSEPPRRSSFWQLDRIHCNRAMEYRENRRTTRLSEKIPAKRRIRTPKWLLEDSGTLENNAPLKLRRQHPRLHYLPIVKRSEGVKNNTKDKVNTDGKVKEIEKKQQKEVQSDPPAAVPQVVLELSLPDNELLGTFTDESCNRHRGLPQMLFYRPTVKILTPAEPEKSTHQNEVILKAQDAATFTQMLHCYARRPKGKKSAPASSVTRSSGHVSVSKEGQLCDKPAVEMKVTISEQTVEVTEKELNGPREKRELPENAAVIRDTDKVQEEKVKQSSSIVKVITESAVEMKVRVASQQHRHSPRLGKSQNADPNACTVSKKSTAEKKKTEISDKSPPVSSSEHSKSQDPIVTNLEALLNGTPNQEEETSSAGSENSQVPVDKASVKCRDGMSEAKSIEPHTATDSINSLPPLNLQTEIKMEEPKNLNIHKDLDRVNNELRECKIENNLSMSAPSCSLPTNPVWDDDDYDSMEPHPECEESKLEFCCFFCHKDIKGSQVVPHAMFHYRKDECMFCGMAFKNDLKAMMHLSNHLEKLKKLQNAPTDKTPKKLKKTKDEPKNSVQVEIVSNETKRGRGRPRKQLETVIKSGYKFRDTNKKQDQQCTVKDLGNKSQQPKVNGHIGKRKVNDRLKDNLITTTRLRHRSNETSIHKNHKIKRSSFAVKIEKEEPLETCSEENHKEKITCKAKKQTLTDKTDEEKLCCPVEGCSWSTYKNRVAFLYHALEDHHSDSRPLELAFRMANNVCSICKRVLYSFEHFQHHIERHRTAPRHPCLHKGCTARFKTAMEMRRHARKHSPLQAVCCVPGCPKLFICLWALILHEKDHYSKRSQKHTQVGVKQESEKPKDKDIKKDVKSSCGTRPAPLTLKEKTVKAPISSVKLFSKDKNKNKDLNISKNLSAQSAATRLLQKLRKRQVTSRAQQRTQIIMSNVGKPHKKLRHELRKSKSKEESQRGDVLLPRLTKKSQNGTSDPKQESNPAKTSMVSRKSKDNINKNSDGTRTTAEVKVHHKHQKLADAKVARKKDRNSTLYKISNSKTPNTEKTKSAVQKFEEVAAPVGDSPIIEEDANLDITDTTDSMAPVNDYKNASSTLDKTEEASAKEKPIHHNEKVACQDEASEILESTNVAVQVVEDSAVEVCAIAEATIISHDDSTSETTMPFVDHQPEHIPAPVVDNVCEVNSETQLPDSSANVTCKVEKCDHEAVVGEDNSELEENSKIEASDSLLNNPSAITNDNAENILKPENVEDKDSKMAASSIAPSYPHSITDIPRKLATPQYNSAKEELTGTTDHAINTAENKAQPIVKESFKEVSNIDVFSNKTDALAFENTLQVQNIEQSAAQGTSTLKTETRDVSAKHDKITPAITSELQKVGHVSISEHLDCSVSSTKNTHDSAIVNVWSSLNETPSRPAADNKDTNQKMGSSIKSDKGEQVVSKNEDKMRPQKRQKEPIKTSATKRLKSNMEDNKHMAAPVMKTTDSNTDKSSAPAFTSNSVKEASNEKTRIAKVKKEKKMPTKDEEVVKKQSVMKNKAEKKPKNTSKNVEDKTMKKRKKQLTKSKTDKTKPIGPKVHAKSTKTQAPSSSQVEKFSMGIPKTSTQLMAATSFSEDQPTTTEENNPASNTQENVITVKKQQTDADKAKTERNSSDQKVTSENEACLKYSGDVYSLEVEDENPLAAFEKALNEYKKRPYMRLPATAYLEEKFTIMPKRQKDMSMFFGSARKSPKPHETVAPQRRRCANCFATFSSEEELQLHLQQKCSNLFGFDSDDEGTS